MEHWSTVRSLADIAVSSLGKVEILDCKSEEGFLNNDSSPRFEYALLRKMLVIWAWGWGRNAEGVGTAPGVQLTRTRLPGHFLGHPGSIHVRLQMSADELCSCG